MHAGKGCGVAASRAGAVALRLCNPQHPAARHPSPQQPLAPAATQQSAALTATLAAAHTALTAVHTATLTATLAATLPASLAATLAAIYAAARCCPGYRG